ncbi:uncharacterized protein LOC126232131, partial [Schistocerca nitens]
MRKNKAELPPSFSTAKGRNVSSSIYGYSGSVTILSHVPKKNKVVNLISTMHHGECMVENKPEIIHDYNKTKGGVDALDEKTHNYTTSRRTRRWPMAVFYTMLDIAGVNAFVLYHGKEDTDDVTRREFLIEL